MLPFKMLKSHSIAPVPGLATRTLQARPVTGSMLHVPYPAVAGPVCLILAGYSHTGLFDMQS